MPHGLSDDRFDELTGRYEDIYGDLIELGMVNAESAIADAADAIMDAGDDPSEVLERLLDEREEANAAYLDGLDVEWDISEYDDYNLDDDWFYYH